MTDSLVSVESRNNTKRVLQNVCVWLYINKTETNLKKEVAHKEKNM